MAKFHSSIFKPILEYVINPDKKDCNEIISQLQVILQLNDKQFIIEKGEPVNDINGQPLFYYPDYYSMHYEVMGIFTMAVINNITPIVLYLMKYPLLDVSHMDNYLFEFTKQNSLLMEQFIFHNSFIPSLEIIKYLASINKYDLVGKLLLESANFDNDMKLKRSSLINDLRNFDYRNFLINLERKITEIKVINTKTIEQPPKYEEMLPPVIPVD